MILYTSGTTSRAEGRGHDPCQHCGANHESGGSLGVVSKRSNFALLAAAPCARNHQRCLLCAVGGRNLPMLPRFEANAVWDCIAGGELTLFMAVPTVYAKLIAAWDAASPERRAELSAACSRLRLMVSGSAALPVSTLERWKEISGHTLLERYGMTEIGMALSNPLHGERVPGSVGRPLPGVEVRLVGATPSRLPRERRARSKSVVRVCLRNTGPEPTPHARPSAMAGFALAIPRWSRTAYIASLAGPTSTYSRPEATKYPRWRLRKRYAASGSCRMCRCWSTRSRVGRTRLRGRCAARGWMPSICRPFAPGPGSFCTVHKLPSRLLVLDALPRNAMGKVMKPALAELFQSRI